MKDIQTYLQSRGYVADQEREAFIGAPADTTLPFAIAIPFSVLEGHTLESFQALAEERGWIVEPEEVTIRTLYTPPHCDQFEESKDASLSCHTPEETPNTEIHLRLKVRHLSPDEQRYFINGIAEYGKKLLDEIHICRLAKP